MKHFTTLQFSIAHFRRIGTAGLLLAGVFSSACFGQGPQPLVPDTGVTGQCRGRTGDPGCVLPNLFGATGLTVYPMSAFPHYAHFLGSAQTTLNQTLSTAIATQLAVLNVWLSVV